MVGWRGGGLGLAGVLSLGAAMFGCRPSIEGRPSEVDAPRIVAVRADPAEVPVSTEVALRALVASPDVADDDTVLDWRLCNVRKPLASPGTIAGDCLEATPPAAASEVVGSAPSVAVTIPQKACEVFGPTPPAPEPGEPMLRPADPDTSGGYYQPVTLTSPAVSEGAPAIGYVRLACGLGAVTIEDSVEYRRRYHRNTNPEVAELAIERADGERTVVEPGGDPVRIERGEALSVEVSWQECPLADTCDDGVCGVTEVAGECPEDCGDPVKACTGAEGYLYYDPGSRALVNAREALRVSWLATAGSFERDRTGRTASEIAADSSNRWIAPSGSGPVRMWIVLHDDRGGVGWRAAELQVD
ncbi:MAG: hypothetical protein JW751_09745 [Polyangiaceae bacterium]|nr:hypothetical protein [Polyangiaceae bacterium]